MRLWMPPTLRHAYRYGDKLTARICSPSMPTPDVRRLVANFDAIDFLGAADDLPAVGVDAHRHVHPVDVHGGVEAALGEDVDHDPQRQRVVEEFVLAVDARVAGDGVGANDGD